MCAEAFNLVSQQVLHRNKISADNLQDIKLRVVLIYKSGEFHNAERVTKDNSAGRDLSLERNLRILLILSKDKLDTARVS